MQSFENQVFVFPFLFLCFSQFGVKNHWAANLTLTDVRLLVSFTLCDVNIQIFHCGGNHVFDCVKYALSYLSKT